MKSSGGLPERYVYFIVSIVAILWFVSPLFRFPSAWGSTRDWGYYIFLEEVARTTILQYHQFPLWNPYYFGGTEYLANPQTSVLSPTFFFILMFGTALGIKIGIVLYVILGWGGMFLLLRHFGAEESGAFFGAILYGCSGFFAQHVGGGHWGFAAVNLFPWAVLFYLKGLSKTPYLLGCSVVCAWITFHWGIYTLPFVLMILFVFAVGEAFGRRSHRPLLKYFGIMSIALCLAAVKVLPVGEYILRYPRPVIDWDRLYPFDFIEIFFLRHTGRNFTGHQWVWPEYGNYMGLVPLPFLLYTLSTKIKKSTLLWGGCLFFASLMFGNYGSIAPYSLLKHLPVFENLRVPSRYSIGGLLFLTLIIGMAVSSVHKHIERKYSTGWRSVFVRCAPFIVIALFVIDAVGFNRQQFYQSFHLPPPDGPVSSQFQMKSGDPNHMYAYPRANQGCVHGFEESPVPVSSAIQVDLPAEFYLSDPAAGEVSQTLWSPNLLCFEADIKEPVVLMVNQNFNPGWKAVTGHSLVNLNGLLAVRLHPGEYGVRLEFSPLSVFIGSLLSGIVGILGLVYMWRRK